MPSRRSNLGRRTRRAEGVRRVVASENQEERALANDHRRQRMIQIRANEAAERRAARLEDARLRVQQSRNVSSYLLLSRQIERCQRETDQRQTRLHAQQSRDLNRLAFRYNPAEDYSLSRNVLIGTMTEVCPYCKALKFTGETKGMCCAVRKMKLPHIEEPPEPLKTLLVGYTAESKHFLSNIRKYNSCFQMTLFAAEIITTQLMPTFKVKGQIYHKVGSLLPFPDNQHKFLQMYLIGDNNNELNACCGISTGIKRSNIAQLQDLLYTKNNLLHLFKTATEMMPSDTQDCYSCWQNACWRTRAKIQCSNYRWNGNCYSWRSIST